MEPLPLHAEQKYLPSSSEERRGRALCLSGGGFRASLFHLGALRRLNELGILSGVDIISSVSGGSIIAGFLASRISQMPPVGDRIPNWDEVIALPFRHFTGQNLRNPAIFERLLPWNWFRSSYGVEKIASILEKKIVPLKLAAIPDKPRYVLCSTDMAFGVNWMFKKDEMGDYQAGFATTDPSFPLARAIAASACFPPLFNPLPVDHSITKRLKGGMAGNDPDYQSCINGLRLTDGGNYDNFGLEPVWKNCKIVLVSNGGAPFQHMGDRGLLERFGRYVALWGNQVEALRTRWLISNFIAGIMEGTYWGIGSSVKSFDMPQAPGYSEILVKEVISKVRTDLDSFSKAEMNVLENHGYTLADVAIRKHVPGIIGLDPLPLTVPYQKWMDEQRVRKALSNSHKHRMFK